MKKRHLRLLALLLISSMMFTGCGTALYELSDSEEDQIVEYAAYVLGKHNNRQPDGAVTLPQSTLDSIKNGEDQEEVETEAETEETETPVQEENTTAAETSSQPAQEEEVLEEIGLADALGIADRASVAYNGYYVTDNYQEGAHFSVDSKSGKVFVVMQFTVTNTTDTDQTYDMLDNGTSFILNYGSGQSVREDVTLLIYDLSTFTGTIGAGQSQDMALLFEVPTEEKDTVGDVSMTAVKGNEKNHIIL